MLVHTAGPAVALPCTFALSHTDKLISQTCEPGYNGGIVSEVQEIRMPKLPELDKIRFWPLLGLILVVDIVLPFLYTVIVPGLSVSGW